MFPTSTYSCASDPLPCLRIVDPRAFLPPTPTPTSAATSNMFVVYLRRIIGSKTSVASQLLAILKTRGPPIPAIRPARAQPTTKRARPPPRDGNVDASSHSRTTGLYEPFLLVALYTQKYHKITSDLAGTVSAAFEILQPLVSHFTRCAKHPCIWSAIASPSQIRVATPASIPSIRFRHYGRF